MNYILWTLKSCKKVALKCKTKREFSIKFGSAYQYALRNKILNNVCSHMINKRKPDGYWSYDNCKEEALKYNTRNEYRIKSGSSYDRALKNGWLDNICSQMKLVGNRNRRCIYSYEFSDNYVYVGLTHNIKERQLVRDNDLTDSVTKHKNDTNLTPIRKQLTEYIEVGAARKLEGDFLKKYINDGWNVLNIKPTGGIGGSYCRWNKEICMKIAISCKTKKDFYGKHRSAYDAALRNNWISSIYEMFNETYSKKLIYNMEECKREAIKYETKKEFKKNCRGLYEASLRNKWHNEICGHMIHGNTNIK